MTKQAKPWFMNTALILQKKLIEVVEKHSIENGAFWMALSIYPGYNSG